MHVVTVHRGARDGYQVSRALQEAGLLERLVTDLYWPVERPWAQSLERAAPTSVVAALRCRQATGLSSAFVECCWASGIGSLVAHKANWLPFEWQSQMIRWCDRVLGERAGRLATQTDAAVLSYSYYAQSALSNYQGTQPRMLFQLHPHPLSVRSILQRERDLHSDCASSLDKEWELNLPEKDFRRLVDEVEMAQHWIVASRFTRETLVEAGIPAGQIEVIPYGIESDQFICKREHGVSRRPLRLLFVGTIGQRKGIKYLLQALDLLPRGSVELTICGRQVDDLALVRQSRIPVTLRPSISARGLKAAYREADIFVLPSLAEGFGHVLLEAMASGLPIISTTRTAAPDLIEDGREGYVIAPGSATEIASRVEEFLKHPEKVRTMSLAAAQRAELFTWQRFRRHLAGFVQGVLAQSHDRSIQQSCLSR